MTVGFEVAERIRLKKAQYCRFLDTKQWVALQALALPTALLKFYDLDGQVMEIAGIRYDFASPHAFTKTMAVVFAKAHTSHMVTNSELEVLPSGDVSAIWAMQDRLVFPSVLGLPITFLGCGHYHEIWTKVEGDWFLKSLELKRTIRQPSAAARLLSRLPVLPRS